MATAEADYICQYPNHKGDKGREQPDKASAYMPKKSLSINALGETRPIRTTSQEGQNYPNYKTQSSKQAKQQNFSTSILAKSASNLTNKARTHMPGRI